MSEHTDADIDPETEAPSGEPSGRTRRDGPRSGSGTDSPLEWTDLRTAVLWGALGLLALLAAYSLFQFYAFSSAAIDEWVADGYRELFQAGFNLVVLLVSGAGIAAVVRRLTARRSEGPVD